MKVLTLTSTFLPDIGGAELAIAELSNALYNLGVDINLIAPLLRRKTLTFHSYPILSHNITVKRVKLMKTLAFLSMIYVTLKSWEKYDVYHAHFLYPTGFAGLTLKHLFHKPCIVTMHGVDIQVDVSIKYGMRLDWRLDKIIKFVLRNVDALIAPSKLVAEEAIKAGADPSKVYVLPNGVNVSRFNPDVNGEIIRKRLGINSEDQVLLTISRFHLKKGYRSLAKAMPIVIKKYPNAKFILCGRGPERPIIMDMVKSSGLSKNVVFTGFIDESEKPMYYAASDVFIIPSILENAPLTILEALASGKPVVATRTGNISGIIRDGISGILVDPDEPVQLAQAIIQYLETPSLREKGGRIGRKDIIEHYSWGTIARKTLKLYEKITKKY